MAFLDNSGDIILDAVLTDVGRKRMAQGRFRVSKFALGDDEIDYSLYNKTHPSGAAYYDLEILQTPIFEAMPGSGISHGLVSYTRNDLLYTPEILLNGLLTDAMSPSGAVYYFSANQETSEKLKSVFGSEKYILTNGSATGQKLIFEIGINNAEVPATRQNKRSYLNNTNLNDKKVHVFADNRFINGVMSSTSRARFANKSDGTKDINFGGLSPVNATSKATSLKNHNAYVATTVSNNIYTVSDVDVSQYSVLKGAKAAAFAMNFTIPVEMAATSTGVSDIKYSLYGTTSDAIFGGSQKYDYVDTTVYVEGSTSGCQVQVPVRIIRYAGT